MNLDRFDGYPGGEERYHPPPTAWERWQALGFDPAEEVGPEEEETAWRSYLANNTSCIQLFKRGDIASSDATKGLSDRPLKTFGRHL